MNPRQCPTRRQLEVLRAYIAAGSIAVAARELGITDVLPIGRELVPKEGVHQAPEQVI